MNGKLHHSISALIAAGGVLVLGLVAMIPLPAPADAPAQGLTQFAGDVPATHPVEVDLGAVKARIRFDHDFLARARSRSGDLAGAARRIEASAARLENAASATELADFAGTLAGDIADLTAMANAIDPAPTAAAQAVSAQPKRKASTGARRSRSNLVMPYFSFMSRG